jgi:hypothetical protein
LERALTLLEVDIRTLSEQFVHCQHNERMLMSEVVDLKNEQQTKEKEIFKLQDANRHLQVELKRLRAVEKITIGVGDLIKKMEESGNSQLQMLHHLKSRVDETNEHLAKDRSNEED